jgi:hypothetical protein
MNYVPVQTYYMLGWFINRGTGRHATASALMGTFSYTSLRGPKLKLFIGLTCREVPFNSLNTLSHERDMRLLIGSAHARMSVGVGGWVSVCIIVSADSAIC